MYTVVYLFPVHRSNIPTFLRVQKAAGEIYLRYGALADETLAPVDVGAAYGCAGFSSLLELREGEDLYIGLSRFRDRAHNDAVMAKVDADVQIDALYAEMSSVLEMPRVVRGAFAGAV